MNEALLEYLPDTEAIDAFATKLGISESTCYRWLRGANVPTMRLRKEIARVTKGAVPVASWEV